MQTETKKLQMQKMSKEEYYEYIEPHSSGGTCTIRMTHQQAIYWTYRAHMGLSDAQALQAFIVIHRAYKVENKDV